MDCLTIIISIVSLVTTLWGLYLLGKKDKLGFMAYNISLVCQIYLFKGNTFIVIQLFILAVFNIRNFLKWRKEETNAR